MKIGQTVYCLCESRGWVDTFEWYAGRVVSADAETVAVVPEWDRAGGIKFVAAADVFTDFDQCTGEVERRNLAAAITAQRKWLEVKTT